MVKMTIIKVGLILIWNLYRFIGFQMKFSYSVYSYKQKYLGNIGALIKLQYLFWTWENRNIFLLQRLELSKEEYRAAAY